MGKKSRWMVRATLVLVLLSTVLPLYAAYWLQRPITSDSGRIRQDYQWSRTYAHAWANPDDILVENWAPQMCCQARIIYTNGNLADTDYSPTISPGESWTFYLPANPDLPAGRAYSARATAGQAIMAIVNETHYGQSWASTYNGFNR